MTISNPILRETHRNARQLIGHKLAWEGSLCSNNQNLQLLMYFEALRQTAYAMINDGGCDLAIEMMEKVIAEMREAKKARRAKSFDEDSFRMSQDRKRNLEKWDIFLDIPYADEVPDEDEDD